MALSDFLFDARPFFEPSPETGGSLPAWKRVVLGAMIGVTMFSVAGTAFGSHAPAETAPFSVEAVAPRDDNVLPQAKLDIRAGGAVCMINEIDRAVTLDDMASLLVGRDVVVDAAVGLDRDGVVDFIGHHERNHCQLQQADLLADTMAARLPALLDAAMDQGHAAADVHAAIAADLAALGGSDVAARLDVLQRYTGLQGAQDDAVMQQVMDVMERVAQDDALSGYAAKAVSIMAEQLAKEGPAEIQRLADAYLEGGVPGAALADNIGMNRMKLWSQAVMENAADTAAAMHAVQDGQDKTADFFLAARAASLAERGSKVIGYDTMAVQQAGMAEMRNTVGFGADLSPVEVDAHAIRLALEMTPGIDQIVEKAFALDDGARPADLMEMAGRLDAFLQPAPAVQVEWIADAGVELPAPG